MDLKQYKGQQRNSKQLAKLLKNSLVAGSEQTEVKNVDYYQIVGPVEQVEDKEDGWEEIHGNPVSTSLE